MRKLYCDGHFIDRKPGYSIVNSEGTLIDTNRCPSNFPALDAIDAEIWAIIVALEMSEKGDLVSTDSMAALSSVNGGRSKTRPFLDEWLWRAHNLMIDKNINLMWERREFNLAGQFNENMLAYHKVNRIREKEEARKRTSVPIEKLIEVKKKAKLRVKDLEVEKEWAKV